MDQAERMSESDVPTGPNKPSLLMSSSWRYLLGLVVLSMQYGFQLDIPIFLNFFYIKACKEVRFTFYARRKVWILEDLLTCDKGWKDKYFFVKREGLFGPKSGILIACPCQVII